MLTSDVFKVLKIKLNDVESLKNITRTYLLTDSFTRKGSDTFILRLSKRLQFHTDIL